MALAFLLFAAPPGVAAQEREWPTLSAAGIEYISESGFLQVLLSGQLDLEAMHLSDSWVGLAARTEGDAYIADNELQCVRCHRVMGLPGEGGVLPNYRLRLFTDVFVGDHLYSLIELRSDRGHVPRDASPEVRVEQAYVRLTSGGGGPGLQVGRFATPFGSYSARHLSQADVFLRPPLAHDARTLMSRTIAPRDADFLMRWQNAIRFFRKDGATPVWDVPYPWGVMALWTHGGLDLRLAMVNSAPSSPPEAWDWEPVRFRNPSWVGGVRLRPSASLELGASFSRGPWMAESVTNHADPASQADVPPLAADSLDQELLSLDAGLARGPWTIRGEWIRDRWEVKNLSVYPTEHVYSLEVERNLSSRWLVAARIGFLDFRPLEDVRPLSGGTATPGLMTDWDYDVTRYEASVGYRVGRNVGLLVSGLAQRRAPQRPGINDALEAGHAAEERGGLVGLRAWWAF